MNVKQLKEYLKVMPDDAVLLCPASDHQLAVAHLDFQSAMVYTDGRGRAAYVKNLGDSYNEPGGKHVPAIVIS